MEVDAPSSRVGYNTKLFENSQAIKKFTCVICNNVLRDAVQIPQSVDPKRACSDCYKNNIRFFCIKSRILRVLVDYGQKFKPVWFCVYDTRRPAV